MAIAAAADLVLDTVLVKKYDGFGPRYTSYPTADRFHSGVTAERYVDALHARNQERPTAPLSLYLHIPFCNTICYYCACNKVIPKDRGRSAKYIKYVGREIEIVSGLVEGGPPARSLTGQEGPPGGAHAQVGLAVDVERPDRLRDGREGGLPAHLVLNACTREKDLARTIDAWMGLPVDRLAFTRLDEAGACGHLFNLLVRTGLPLTDLGTGPRIPEDFTDQGLAGLLRRIWPSGEGHGGIRAASPGTVRTADALAQRGQWAANGNSELYHRSDCKWVRKIKSEQLIHFTSAAEAESRQFVACRNCHPQRNLRPDADAAGRSAVQAAGIR